MLLKENLLASVRTVHTTKRNPDLIWPPDHCVSKEIQGWAELQVLHSWNGEIGEFAVFQGRPIKPY